jgi:hypothetical protein
MVMADMLFIEISSFMLLFVELILVRAAGSFDARVGNCRLGPMQSLQQHTPVMRKARVMGLFLSVGTRKGKLALN